MADFDRSYHHHQNFSSSYSYNPRLSTDQNPTPPFSLNPSRPSTDQQPTSYSYSYSYNPSRPSTDQAPPYNSYEYNGRMEIVPRQQPLPPVAVAPRQVAVVGSSGGPWCFGDPEMKRKRRVASYKAYSVEGKVKASIRKGFRWIKVKCSEIIHGWLFAGPLIANAEDLKMDAWLRFNKLGPGTREETGKGRESWLGRGRANIYDFCY